MFDDAMVEHTFVLKAEEQFFEALQRGDGAVLRGCLDEDFVMIDLAGSVLKRHAFISAVESGELRFESIRVMNSEVRFYGETAIVTGEGEIRGFGRGQRIESFVRYTHVYQEQEDDSFVLVSAQGTTISREARP
jgi:ketosteroid isomerase-like protein